MKFVQSYSKQDFQKQKTAYSYDKFGDLVTSNKDKVFAQYLETDLNGSVQTKYFIATHNNVPYDPNGIDSHRESSLNITLKPVSKQVFEYYTLYLKTKNSLYMTRTQRSYINV